jgi:phage tail P2-like protein
MPGQLISGTPFNDLLPSSIRDDPQMRAASQALDALFAESSAQIRQVLIWARIDELEEPMLSNLAYQLHLDGYEGWGMAQTLEQKRRLVRNAIILHFHKGTRYSLERIFELLDMRGDVVEWWESDEPIEDFPPYTFDIDVQATRSIDDRFYTDVFNLIYALKNVRSQDRKSTRLNSSH